MGFKTIILIPDYKIILLFVCIVFLSTMTGLDSATIGKVNCRKYVHAPECRGIAAKRDTRISDDYRFYVDMEKDNYDRIYRRNLWDELLRTMEKNMEYDTGIGSYVD